MELKGITILDFRLLYKGERMRNEMSIMKLKEQLEEKRRLLYGLINNEDDLAKVQIINCSQELDILINKYNELTKEK